MNDEERKEIAVLKVQLKGVVKTQERFEGYFKELFGKVEKVGLELAGFKGRVIGIGAAAGFVGALLGAGATIVAAIINGN